MSSHSNYPPQLHLTLPSNSTSFKRSFEEFGFDLESPVGPNTEASGSGIQSTASIEGNERNKRARSQSSSSLSGSTSETLSSGSPAESARSSTSSVSNIDLDAEGSSSIPAIRPSVLSQNFADTSSLDLSIASPTLPPRIPTPDIQDVEMPHYLPSEEIHPSVSNVPTATHPESDEGYRISLERFNAFDTHISALRRPLSPPTVRSPTTPPTLPPLAIPPLVEHEGRQFEDSFFISGPDTVHPDSHNIPDVMTSIPTDELDWHLRSLEGDNVRSTVSNTSPHDPRATGPSRPLTQRGNRRSSVPSSGLSHPTITTFEPSSIRIHHRHSSLHSTTHTIESSSNTRASSIQDASNNINYTGRAPATLEPLRPVSPLFPSTEEEHTLTETPPEDITILPRMRTRDEGAYRNGWSLGARDAWHSSVGTPSQDDPLFAPSSSTSHLRLRQASRNAEQRVLHNLQLVRRSLTDARRDTRRHVRGPRPAVDAASHSDSSGRGSVNLREQLTIPDFPEFDLDTSIVSDAAAPPPPRTEPFLPTPSFRGFRNDSIRGVASHSRESSDSDQSRPQGRPHYASRLGNLHTVVWDESLVEPQQLQRERPVVTSSDIELPSDASTGDDFMAFVDVGSSRSHQPSQPRRYTRTGASNTLMSENASEYRRRTARDQLMAQLSAQFDAYRRDSDSDSPDASRPAPIGLREIRSILYPELHNTSTSTSITRDTQPTSEDITDTINDSPTRPSPSERLMDLVRTHQNSHITASREPLRSSQPSLNSNVRPPFGSFPRPGSTAQQNDSSSTGWNRGHPDPPRAPPRFVDTRSRADDESPRRSYIWNSIGHRIRDQHPQFELPAPSPVDFSDIYENTMPLGNRSPSPPFRRSRSRVVHANSRSPSPRLRSATPPRRAQEPAPRRFSSVLREPPQSRAPSYRHIDLEAYGGLFRASLERTISRDRERERERERERQMASSLAQPRNTNPPSLPPLSFIESEEELFSTTTESDTQSNRPVSGQSQSRIHRLLQNYPRAAPGPQTRPDPERRLSDEILRARRQDVHDYISRQPRMEASRIGTESDHLPGQVRGFNHAIDVLRADGLNGARQQQLIDRFWRGRNEARRPTSSWGELEDGWRSSDPPETAPTLIRRRPVFGRPWPGEEEHASNPSPSPSRPETFRDHPRQARPSLTQPTEQADRLNANRMERSARLRALRQRQRETFGDLPRFEFIRTGVGRGRFLDLGDFMRDEDFDSSYEGLLSISAALGEVRSKATAENVIASLPTGQYKDWATPDTDQRCPICLDDYKPQDPVLKLTDCSHWLHKDCLEQWLHSASTCPVCRRRVRGPDNHSPSLGEPGPSTNTGAGRSQNNDPEDEVPESMHELESSESLWDTWEMTPPWR